jgi:hypothetical protein|tara:strand:- start:672 stop:935 length:264 start_codon:yes stop_codon:yes gene_type:complete
MEKKKDSKKTKYMAGGGSSKKTKYMAGGGKSTKYMAGGGKSTKYMAGGGKMGTEVGKEQKVQSYKEYVKNMFGGGMTSVPAMKKNKR